MKSAAYNRVSATTGKLALAATADIAEATKWNISLNTLDDFFLFYWTVSHAQFPGRRAVQTTCVTRLEVFATCQFVLEYGNRPDIGPLVFLPRMSWLFSGCRLSNQVRAWRSGGHFLPNLSKKGPETAVSLTLLPELQNNRQ